MRQSRAFALGLCLFLGCLAPLSSPLAAAPPESAPRAAASDFAQVDPALFELRAAGPEGLERLLAQRDQLLKEQTESPSQATSQLPRPDLSGQDRLPAQLAALDQRLDFVGGALRTAQSRLYWYTDQQEAQAAAQRTGKPILHLRLLGKLTDEYSCANSRFFRSLLYSNDAISQYLREHYILSWQTVVNAPRITIDFGDGRTIERTITGNSIHYILASDGTVIDALPGLYGPQAFLERLKSGAGWARQYRAAPASARRALLVRHQLEGMLESAKRWHADLEAIGAPLARDGALAMFQQGKIEVRDGASVDDYLAQFGDDVALAGALGRHLAWLDQQTTDSQWRQISILHAEDAKIDDATRERMRAERPMAPLAGRLAMTKRVVEDPMLRLVRNLEGTVALDAVRNEYALRSRIRSLLAHNPATMTRVDSLNEIVYAEVFLMPLNDPWLGLAPADVYTGLPDAGTRLPRVAETRAAAGDGGRPVAVASEGR